MDIIEEAKKFAILAHKGQFRESEPELAKIIHPLSVGQLLDDFGLSNPLVAAGYLHDVLDDTEYTVEDIKEKFGEDIANLVSSTAGPEKSLSWEEKKRQAIEKVKNMPLRNKYVVCADKLNELEDLLTKFQRTNQRDFSLFERGELWQKGYYEGIYQSLIYGENSKEAIFERLRVAIEMVFENDKSLFFNKVPTPCQVYNDQLISLCAQRQELERLKRFCSLGEPIVVEFYGTFGAYKNALLTNLCNSFKTDFRVGLIEETDMLNHYKNDIIPYIDNIDIKDLRQLVFEEADKHENGISAKMFGVYKDYDIVFIDRSLTDRSIWNYYKYYDGEISEEQYRIIVSNYPNCLDLSADMLAIIYNCYGVTHIARPEGETLDQRHLYSSDNVIYYNDCLDQAMESRRNFFSTKCRFYGANINSGGPSLLVESEILPVMREKYVEEFNLAYTKTSSKKL